MFFYPLLCEQALLLAGDWNGKVGCGFLSVSGDSNPRAQALSGSLYQREAESFLSLPLKKFSDGTAPSYKIFQGEVLSHCNGDLSYRGGIFGDPLLIFFVTLKAKFNRFFNVFLSFFKCPALREASRNCRTLSDNVSIFAFCKEYFIARHDLIISEIENLSRASVNGMKTGKVSE